jgi:hypothetical protein
VNGGRGRTDRSGEPRLPKGAEAALWSILEAVPDPRNHLILARDLSGEVRITDYERATAAAAFATAPTIELPPLEEEIVDLREAMDPYYDLGAIAENTPLTENLFTTAE